MHGSSTIVLTPLSTNIALDVVLPPLGVDVADELNPTVADVLQVAKLHFPHIDCCSLVYRGRLLRSQERWKHILASEDGPRYDCTLYLRGSSRFVSEPLRPSLSSVRSTGDKAEESSGEMKKEEMKIPRQTEVEAAAEQAAQEAPVAGMENQEGIALLDEDEAAELIRPRRRGLARFVDPAAAVRVGILLLLFSEDGGLSRPWLIVFAVLLYLFQVGLIADLLQSLQHLAGPRRDNAAAPPVAAPNGNAPAPGAGAVPPAQANGDQNPPAENAAAPVEPPPITFSHMVQRFFVGLLASLVPSWQPPEAV